MSRKFLLWAMALVVIIPALFGTGYWLYWDRFIRYAPVTITNVESQIAIQTLLDQADYLSPGKKDRWVYLVTYRGCKACRDYENQEFPKLQAAGIETRVIVYTLADDKGVKRSTPAERATVAELWLTRNWAFYQAWQSATDDTWTADGLTSADTDWGRRAVVIGAQDYVNQLAAELRNDKVTVGFPLIIWRDKNNQIRVCGCTTDKAYHFIREDLGASDGLLGPQDLLDRLPGNLKMPSFGSEGSASSSPASVPAATRDANAPPAGVQ